MIERFVGDEVSIQWHWLQGPLIAELESQLQSNCLKFVPLVDDTTLEFVTVETWLKNSVVALAGFRKASPWHRLKIIEKLYGAAYPVSDLAFRRIR